ncbi:MAG: YetF domain-containing protein [Bacteroidota bacterium]
MDYVLEWERVLFNNLPAHFLFEVGLRTAVMFIFLLITLKLTGKRGIKQLSVFETVIIISLGSAAGDPMFYEDVGLIPALLVFAVVLSLYRAVTWFIGKSVKFERFMEGKTECLVVNGKFSSNKFERESLSLDEFFTELRIKSVEHLGQVKEAYLETTGDVSVYFFENKDVKYGLPITPALFFTKSELIVSENIYACAKCGDTKELSPGQHSCVVCNNKEWVLAINTLRVT